jgi:DNA polymerase III subunit delta'
VRCVEPIGHGAVLAGLWRAARAGRLAHALCFAGPDGVGKHLAAEWFAFGLFCERGPVATGAPGASIPSGPCGLCGPCKRLKAGSHPDVFVLDPESEDEESIKIERVAARTGGDGPSIEEFLSLRAMEGGWRVVIVREAHLMVEAAQNALLKTLEEPGESTLLVLGTAHPEDLLPTVQSRCVRVSFARVALPDVERLLAARGLAPDESRALARWSGGVAGSGGAPGRALSLHARGAAAMRDLLRGVLAGEVEPLDAARAIADIDLEGGGFPGKTPLARSRARARTCLDLSIAVLQDAVRLRSGLDPAGLAHGDLAQFAGGAAGPSERSLLSSLERALVARQDVDRNLAPDAALERAWIALGDLAPVSSGSSGGQRRTS